MHTAITRNTNDTIVVKCKPEALEGFWHRRVMDTGNKELAKEMGVHPTGLSRDKTRIVKMACQLVTLLGLPEGVVANSECAPTVIIQGEEAREAAALLIEMLDHIREPKEKTPNA